MRWVAALVAGLCLTARAAAAPDTAAQLRTDLSPAFGQALCAGTLGDLPLAAWRAGVHDAQVEGRFLTRLGGRPVGRRELEHKARALAQLRGAGGYAYGTCETGRGWALALPAPEPLLAEAGGRQRLPMAALAARCSSFRADFAARDQGPPRPLPLAGGTISTAGLGDGVVSLTCQPKAPRWRGPVLWYLVPIGTGPAAAPPGAEALAPPAAGSAALAAWINRIRTLEGLRPVAYSDELRGQAEILAVGGALAHDRLLLARAQARLADAPSPLRLLGEERVKGQTAAQMAWLLWNSPRHRDLLLRRDATVAGLGESVTAGEHLTVLVLGAQAPLQTAKAQAAPTQHL